MRARATGRGRRSGAARCRMPGLRLGAARRAPTARRPPPAAPAARWQRPQWPWMPRRRTPPRWERSAPRSLGSLRLDALVLEVLQGTGMVGNVILSVEAGGREVAQRRLHRHQVRLVAL